MKYKIIILLSLLASGCSSFQPPWRYMNNVSSLKAKTSYTLETKYSAPTGSQMLSARTYREQIWYEPISFEAVIWNGYTLLKPSHTSNYVFKPTYKLSGNEGDYILTAQSFYNGAIGVIAYDDGTVPENPVMRIDTKGSMQRFPIKPVGINKQIFKKRVSELTDINNKFMFELIYTGKSDQTITLVYREYINDMSRDSFRQTLTYNLDESKEIRFKSLKINVIEATNSYISFIIEDDEGLQWML